MAQGIRITSDEELRRLHLRACIRGAMATARAIDREQQRRHVSVLKVEVFDNAA